MLKKELKRKVTFIKDAQKLAVLLHAHFCKLGHIERCTWYYERGWKGNLWNFPEHKRWLKTAKKVLKESELMLPEIIKALKYITSIEKIVYK